MSKNQVGLAQDSPKTEEIMPLKKVLNIRRISDSFNSFSTSKTCVELIIIIIISRYYIQGALPVSPHQWFPASLYNHLKYSKNILTLGQFWHHNVLIKDCGMITYGSIVGHVLKWGTTGLEENFHQRSE
jgi:hypothetical protein